MKRSNIVLIGMPGCGKSTVGVVLAKALGYSFIDTDLMIQQSEGRLLCEIIDSQGADGFIAIENRILSGMNVTKSVIATGGSAVYGSEAMLALRETGVVVYLRLACDEIINRVGDIGGASRRGVVMRRGQTLCDVYAQRTPLYEKYADITIDAEGLSLRETVRAITDALRTINI